MDTQMTITLHIERQAGPHGDVFRAQAFHADGTAAGLACWSETTAVDAARLAVASALPEDLWW